MGYVASKGSMLRKGINMILLGKGFRTRSSKCFSLVKLDMFTWELHALSLAELGEGLQTIRKHDTKNALDVNSRFSQLKLPGFVVSSTFSGPSKILDPLACGSFQPSRNCIALEKFSL